MTAPCLIALRFVREPGLLSWLIDRGTGGFLKQGARWSHVGILIGGNAVPHEMGSWLFPTTVFEFGARDSVDGSVTGKAGVQLRPQNYARFADQIIINIPITQDEWTAFWALAAKVNGAPYSSATIEGFLLGEQIPDDPKTVAFDCSTLVAWLMLNCSKTLFPQGMAARLREISPNALYDIARVIEFYRHQT